MEQEAVAVAGKDEGNVEGFCVVEALLHTGSETMRLILRLDQGKRLVGLVVQHVVRPLALAPAVELAAHDDAALGEADFLADLRLQVPAGREQSRGNQFAADITLRQLGHGHSFRLPDRAGMIRELNARRVVKAGLPLS